MKIYNRKVFIFGIIQLITSILYICISLNGFGIKLLIVSLILLGYSFICIVQGFSKKVYQQNLSALQSQKELEKTNRALKFLNSGEKISSGMGIFFASISLVLLIITLIAIIK
nr:hypothetical protein [uncultured Aminipila sp.]